MTPIYIILLRFSDRNARQHRRSIADTTLGVVVVTLFLLNAMIVLLRHMSYLGDTLIYPIFVASSASLFVYALRSSSSSKRIQVLILLSAITFHLALVVSPPSGIAIGERTAAKVQLAQEGHRTPGAPYQGAYNPFPMDIGFYCTISMLTTFPLISPLNGFIIWIFLEGVFDLILYALVRRITGSWVAGIFAIVISALTPTLAPGHEAKYPAMLLFLATALALTKALDGKSFLANITLANLTYVSAILFHPSAAIGGFLPLGIVAVSYFAKRVLKNPVWGRLFESRLLRATAALFLVITFARAIYTAGYLESMMPALNQFILTAIGSSPQSATTLPAFERSVPVINAYAWSTPVAMASALVIYSILRRRSLGGSIPLSMSVVAAVFLLFGFLAAYVRAGGFQGAMYPAFSLLMPAAAVIGWIALTSNKASAVALILLMATFAGIAITDPSLSHERYRETGAGDIAPQVEDYLSALFLIDAIPSRKALIAPYEIGSPFVYLETVQDRPPLPYYTKSADRIRDEAVTPFVTNNTVLPEVMYIWPRWWFPDSKPCVGDAAVNVYYNDGRHLVFEQ